MLLNDVATYLAANSTRLSVGASGTLYKSFMPEDPDTVATVYETVGFSPLHTFSTSTDTRLHERPRLNVRTRSTSYETARAVAEDVFTVLDGLANTTLPTATGVAYVSVDALGSPYFIHRDRNDRFVLGVNFQVVKDVG